MGISLKNIGKAVANVVTAPIKTVATVAKTVTSGTPIAKIPSAIVNNVVKDVAKPTVQSVAKSGGEIFTSVLKPAVKVATAAVNTTTSIQKAVGIPVNPVDSLLGGILNKANSSLNGVKPNTGGVAGGLFQSATAKEINVTTNPGGETVVTVPKDQSEMLWLGAAGLAVYFLFFKK